MPLCATSSDHQKARPSSGRCITRCALAIMFMAEAACLIYCHDAERCNDGNSPWQQRSRSAAAHTLTRCNRVLAEWGFPALLKPSPPKTFSGRLTNEPRVNPYGEASPADTPHRGFSTDGGPFESGREHF